MFVRGEFCVVQRSRLRCAILCSGLVLGVVFILCFRSRPLSYKLQARHVTSSVCCGRAESKQAAKANAKCTLVCPCLVSSRAFPPPDIVQLLCPVCDRGVGGIWSGFGRLFRNSIKSIIFFYYEIHVPPSYHHRIYWSLLVAL